MILSKLFAGSSMDFTKKCKIRIGLSVGIGILGMIALAASFLYGTKIPVLYPGTPENQEFVRGFYTGTGGGLIAAAIITIIRNYRLLNNEEKRKARALYEQDERNQLMGTKCWAYAGYAMFLFLYVGILISGFMNILILKTLLCVLGGYGLLLLIFKLLLQRVM